MTREQKIKRTRDQNREPQTMAELLEMEGVELRGLKRGDIIEGTVTEIASRCVFVDIGAKTEGLVVDKEYALAESYIKNLQVGDKVQAYVMSPENDSGQIVLSLRTAAANYIWDKIVEWQTTGEILTVRVKEVNRGGAIVQLIDELEGFIPSSQFTAELANDLNKLLNKEVQIKIIDAIREENKIILSEKAVSEAEDLAKKKAALEGLDAKVVYEGTVTRVAPFGIFVRLAQQSAISDQQSVSKVSKKFKKEGDAEELEAPEGLVHISELSWEKVGEASEFAKVGDKVKVKILQVDPKLGKLSLTIKQLTTDPWELIAEKYPVDKQVKGKVTEVMPFGVFVELEPGIAGLIHLSKLLGKVFQAGDKVDCYVESIDKEGRRLSLGLVLTAKPVGYK